MAISNSRRIIFSDELEDAPKTDQYGDEVLPPESMLIKTFPHNSGNEGLQIEVFDANEKAYFFLTPGEASQLRLWLNKRNF